MTTKVKIEVVQNHMPVAVEVIGADGKVQRTVTLSELGMAVEDYVHSGQTLRVSEVASK